MSYIFRSDDVIRKLLSVMFLLITITACLWILQPFILSFVWAGTVVVTTWPLLLKIQKLFFNNRSLSVLIMTLFLFLIFIIPMELLVSNLVDASSSIIHSITKGKMISSNFLCLKEIPFIGVKLYRSWLNLLETGGSTIIKKIRPYIGITTTWFINQAIYIGRFMTHCILMLIFSALLYWRGEHVALGIRHFAIRIAGQRGDATVLLAAQAIRSVALGIVVTALVQAVLGGIGLAISGVPYATIFTLIMILTCLVQIGPLLVLIPAIIWLYWQGNTSWGTILLVWSCIVGVIDNIIRPALIRMGANLPLILIFSGVIGGLISFGMIGLFTGPVLLAVAWELFSAWVQEVPPPNTNLNSIKIENLRRKDK